MPAKIPSVTKRNQNVLLQLSSKIADLSPFAAEKEFEFMFI
jgi:hypothetical protein